MSDEAQWRADVTKERRWRQNHYTADDSPLSSEALARFGGLRWFEPDAKYRLQGVHLERLPKPKPSTMAATGEDAVAFVEVGHLSFRLHDADLCLTVFEPAPGEVDETYLFIPFRDATSAKTTYGAGRYMDFEPNADDTYELDFNLAYHPYCAFDDAWVCTLPPPENHLPVPIEAGERL